MEKLDPITKELIRVALLKKIREANDLMFDALEKGNNKTDENKAFTVGKSIGRMEVYTMLDSILEDK